MPKNDKNPPSSQESCRLSHNEFTSEIQAALEHLRIDRSYLDHLCAEAGVSPQGVIVVPKGGFQGNNFLISTQEYGDLFFRIHPHEQLQEVGDYLRFESEALLYLNQRRCPVPHLLPFRNGKFVYEDEKAKVYFYPAIPGKNLFSCPMTKTLVEKASQCLSDFRNKSAGFISQLSKKEIRLLGPLTIYEGKSRVSKALHVILSRQPELKTNPPFQVLLKTVMSTPLANRLNTQKMDIVHGDFHIGNMILDPHEKIHLIDFGLVHYGYPVMDIIVSFMTIPCKSLGQWDADLFGVFLTPQIAWLRENNIDFPLFLDLIKLNCLYYGIFTFLYGIKKGTPYNPEKNPHMMRMAQLNDASFMMKLQEIYVSARE